MTTTEKVYRMEGVPEWMSQIAERGEISIASLNGQIFATDVHVAVLCGTAPAFLAKLTETSKPRLSATERIFAGKSTDAMHTTTLDLLRRWCAPGAIPPGCSKCLDEGEFPCAFCGGTGEILTMCGKGDCIHDADCCDCCGEGAVDCGCGTSSSSRRLGSLGGVLVNMKLLWGLLAQLGGDGPVLVSFGTPEEPLRIETPNWKVLAMGMLTSEGSVDAKEFPLK